MKKGFTLVELSIVLVIIGLLVGGVLQGRELIEAAKRNAAISDMTQLSVAINTFRLQYDGFPGDFDEAEDYWGVADTDNGNGDGQICCWTNPVTEFIQFWVHLDESELYKLENADVTSDVRKKINNVDNVEAVISYFKPLTSQFYWAENATFDMKYKHGLYLVDEERDGTWESGSLSAPNFLYPIDKKIDDGLPGRGNILTKDGDNTPSGKNCVIDNGTDSNKYNLNSSTASDTCTAMWYFE